jgi:hypothetical protein
MPFTHEELDELQVLWTEDARNLVPDFVLFDIDRMLVEVQVAREVCNMVGCDDLDVVLHIIRGLDDDKTDVPAAWWWIYACLLILPHVETHPWFEIMWWIHEDMRGKGETTTVWGSASCGKTEGFAAIIVTNMVVWHGDCHIYVSSPYKNAGEDKIWGAVARHFELWEEVPPAWAAALGIRFKLVKDLATVIDKTGGTSNAKFISLETTAPAQGKKRIRIPGQRFVDRKGVIMMIGDELVINPAACANFMRGEGNLISNTNFMGWNAMNPLPEQVLHLNAADLSLPTEVAFEMLNEHVHFTWKTKLGRLIRFCMENSPNRFHVEPIFDFLINQRQAERATKRGESNYQAQVAAWGFAGGLGNGGPLSLDHINRETHQGPPVWLTEQRRWMFVDLAFGGHDPAGYCAFECGTAIVDGTHEDTICILGQEKMAIQRVWTPTKGEIEEFERLAKGRGGKLPMGPDGKNLTAGKEYSANYHMTFQTLRIAAKFSIPRGRVSFDSSLRPDITLMMVHALGLVPWFYSGTRPLKEEQENWPVWPPVAKEEGKEMVTWADRHSEPISAIWRFAEHLVARGHVRGLSRCRAGLLELISRMWIVKAGGRSDIAAKKTLKVSPWKGETLATGLMFGVRFCGALPQLAKEKAVYMGGGVEMPDHAIFKLKPRRVARSFWTR